MPDLAGHEDVLDLIYETAVDASLWPSLLGRFAGMIGGHAASLRSYELYGETGSVVASGVDAGYLDRNFRRFAATNPLKTQRDALLQLVRASPGLYQPGLMRDVEWLPKSDFTRTEYYNEFYKTLDIHSDISIGFTMEGEVWTGVDVYRPARHGAFTDQDLALCTVLLPHFVRARKLARRLSDQRAVGEGLAEVFDRSAHGLFLLDRTGRVRHMNTAGQRLAVRADGLEIFGGRLTAVGGGATRRLQGLIDQAAAKDGARRIGGSMALATPGRLLPLSVVVAPLSAEQTAPLFDGPAVFVCVTDLEAGVSLPESRLRALFDLTPAEARVAIALFEGYDPRQTASHLALSLATVRTHMAHIFEKTHTRGQVELTRLMMRTLGSGVD